MDPLITYYCQYIDAYKYFIKDYKFGIRSLYNKIIIKYKIYHIKHKILSLPMTIELINDFFMNYIATIDNISYDNILCTCSDMCYCFIDKHRSNNIILSITTPKDITDNKTIEVIIKDIKNSRVHIYHYTNNLIYIDNKYIIKEELAKITTDILREYLSKYLDDRICI